MKTEKTKSIQPPRKALAMLYSAHFGKILSNLSVALTFLSIITAIGSFTYIFILASGIILMLASLGTIFIVIPNYWDIIMSGSEFMHQLMDTLTKIWPVAVGLAIGCAAASIVFLALDRKNTHVGRIVFSSVIVAAALIVLIVRMIGGNA